MDERAHGHHRRGRQLALAAAAAFVTVNLWTGAPLLALWIGSRFAGDQSLSMGAVAIVIVVLTVLVYALVTLLGRISAAYDELTGRGVGVARQAPPWLRSMRAERDDTLHGSRGFSTVERLVVGIVAVAALAFNVWFFFFAGSPI